MYMYLGYMKRCRIHIGEERALTNIMRLLHMQGPFLSLASYHLSHPATLHARIALLSSDIIIILQVYVFAAVSAWVLVFLFLCTCMG